MSRAYGDETASFVGVLEHWAERQPEEVAFRFLKTGDSDARTAVITYAGLAQRSRAIAAHLQRRGLSGRRVLLLYPAGLELICGFFGALAAHVVAVPVPVPNPREFDRALLRLRGIAEDADAAAVLTVRPVLERLAQVAEQIPGLAGMPWIATEEIRNPPPRWQLPEPARESVALLQYTSGSIAEPSGVVVTHKNLLANQLALAETMDIRRERVVDSDGHMFVSWLPMFHAMGFILPVLHTVFQGSRSVLMAPEHFLRQPLRWPTALSEFRGDIGGCPNSGYESCVRHADPESVERLDLSRWRVAFNGAEPVRASTLRLFAERFAPAGFRPEALAPVYGLSEATLIVSGNASDRPATVLRGGPAGTRDVVGVGTPPAGVSVLIVDPATRAECPADAMGEVWVSGDSVAQGYLGGRQRADEGFAAETADGRGGFLRTGDLGFRHDGELFVVGRLEDVLVVAGRNLYPHDVEATAENAHSAIRRGCVAAFAVAGEDAVEVVIVAEVDAELMELRDEIEDAVRSAVGADYNAPIGTVVLIRPGSIYKTAGGKIQRSANRDAFLAGKLITIPPRAGRMWLPTAAKLAPAAVAAVGQVRSPDGPRTPAAELSSAIGEEIRTVPRGRAIGNTSRA